MALCRTYSKSGKSLIDSARLAMMWQKWLAVTTFVLKMEGIVAEFFSTLALKGQ
jgi:hypothetical protein